MNFEACLSLPRDPREAALIADSLEALARALGEWPDEAWRRLLAEDKPTEAGGLFERLVARTAPAALNKTHKARALESAQEVAGVLRVLWPEAQTQVNATTTGSLTPAGLAVVTS
jgi:hypothetical protein